MKAVLFTIEAGLAAITLQGDYAKRFVRHLHPLHKPPQNLSFMRIVRIVEQAFFREYSRLIDDNVLWLGSGFASTNSDFYKNAERRESYGCIVANMAAYQYEFSQGRKLFVSQRTLNEGASKYLACKTGTLSQLETVNSFKRFEGSHTGKAVGQWLAEEHRAKGLLPEYVGYHCTDGASNAVASVIEYEVLTENERGSAINHQKCFAHQANRSAKFASGTGDFKNCLNRPLADVLNKCHTIVARVHRSSARLQVIREVQRSAKRTSIVLPNPGVTTRWDSSNREVASLNRIMGDFSKGLNQLISGIDSNKLVAADGTLLPVSDFTFTANDKLVLRQFECGSEPCLLLSKFYQINDATSHETLFVTKAYLALIRATSFVMYDDISHTDLEDLKARNKTVYVLAATHVAPAEDAESGRSVIPMAVCIELFRQLYASDLSERLGLSYKHDVPVPKLPADIAVACLLNPLYGGEQYFLDRSSFYIVT